MKVILTQLIVFMHLINYTLIGSASLYLFGSGDTDLYEVKAFTEDYHSWFIGQTVQRGENNLICGLGQMST